MRWLLAGSYGIAFINLSVALIIYQKPRFYGVKTKQNVRMYCVCSEPRLHNDTQWYKAYDYTVAPENRTAVSTGSVYNTNRGPRALLILDEVLIKDSGVYYCKVNDQWGPGTELQVVRPINRERAIFRSKMKEALMVLQAFMLAACIAALLLRNCYLLQRKDTIYEQPETDHIYEGLAIETCGGDLYDDITEYAQPDEADAPWQ